LGFEQERKMAVSRAPVLTHQFEIGNNGITHTPTGWRRDASGTITKGMGNVFNLDQVADMGRRLRIQYSRNKKTQPVRKTR
jgi:hypothetical protein